MTYRPQRMDFGIFLAPFHRVGENPTLALKRDMQLIEYLDFLGYDEAWIGEHHSFAREIIADPTIFIGAAAQRTKRIRLGTGVTSLPYHHPLMTADRMLQLDHMTEGRAMLGCGPGALTSDAYMMGIDPQDQRRRMNEALDAIVALLRGEVVTMETDWFTLREARMQMANFTHPHLPIAVATTFTPSGPMAAGKHGLGLLSVAGADNAAFERTWGWVEEGAAQSGSTVNRHDWRVVLSMHLSHSKQEALNDIRDGYEKRAYAGDRLNNAAPAGASLFGLPAGSLDEQVERGSLIVGTPDDAIRIIEGVLERSGGFGAVLFNHHEWASTPKTLESYELFARYVAPHFQSQITHMEENRNWVETNMGTVFGGLAGAWGKAFTDAGKELPPELSRGMQQAAGAQR